VEGDDRTTVLGKVSVLEDVVVISGEEELRMTRDRLRAIVPGEPKELNYWSGELSVGLTLRSGNTDQTEMTALGSLRRRTALTRMELGYTGNFSAVDNTENINNHRVTAALDLFVTRRFFVRPLSLEYFRDAFQNIDHRVTPGAGIGYDIFDRTDLEWTVGGGGAYQSTRFVSVPSGEDIERGSGVVLLGTIYEQDLTDDIDIRFDYSTQISMRNVEETSHHGLAQLSVELTRVLNLDVSFLWDRIGKSVSDGTGQAPTEDDFRLIVGFGVEF
jgi:hypothetical protein